MKVNEIFVSIDGEGVFYGKLATFVRFFGCNISCSYCDTKYACIGMNEYQEMTITSIANTIKRNGVKHVTMTGGEPLLQKELPALIDELPFFIVNIETNGSMDISDVLKRNSVITMDYKLPGSNIKRRKEYDQAFFANLKRLRAQDVLKFVCKESDIDYALKLIKDNYPEIKCQIFFSPVFGECDSQVLVERLKSFHSELNDAGICEDNMRIQVQLHKIIWDPTTRGV